VQISRATSLHKELERSHYPIREIEIFSEGEQIVELATALVPTTARAEDLDAIVAHLDRHENIDSATWTVSPKS